MMTRKRTRAYLARTVTLAALVATLGLATLDHAGAADNDPSYNATTEIQVCEAMGGHAEVTIDRTAGRLIVIVANEVAVVRQLIGGDPGYWSRSIAD